MATFKVGQRVRVVGSDRPDSHLLGREGVVAPFPAHATNPLHYEYVVQLDELQPPPCAVWGFRAHQLAPLTDPLADRFIERIKRLEREPMPLGKVLAHKLSEDFYRERA